MAFAWRDAAPALGRLYLQIFTQAIADDGAPTARRLARFKGFAEAHRSAEAAAALGWRFYKDKAAGEAVVWFERALSWSPEGAPANKVGEGYVLSLRAAGRLADAESFAYGLSSDPDMRALYISTVVAELADAKTDIAGARIDRFIATVGAARSALGAQAIGWRRLAGDNCVYAAPWFAKAAAWSADSADDAGTARGLALSLRKVGAFTRAEDLAYAWRDRSPEMAKLYVDIGVEALTSAAPAVTLSEPRVRRLSSAVLSQHHVAGARALGWMRYGQAACGYGGDWLRLAILWGDEDKRDAKTDEGYGLALRTTGRLAEAADLAARWEAQVPPMRKLYIDVRWSRSCRATIRPSRSTRRG